MAASRDDVLAAQVGGDSEEEALRSLGAERVEALLTSLTSDQRDVVSLRVVADLSQEQTASIMGRPVGAVKALQHRALVVLRRGISSGAVSGAALSEFVSLDLMAPQDGGAFVLINPHDRVSGPHTTLKREIRHIHGDWSQLTRSELRTILFDYIETFYSRTRHQAGLEHRTPAETYAASRAA